MPPEPNPAVRFTGIVGREVAIGRLIAARDTLALTVGEGAHDATALDEAIGDVQNASRDDHRDHQGLNPCPIFQKAIVPKEANRPALEG